MSRNEKEEQVVDARRKKKSKSFFSFLSHVCPSFSARQLQLERATTVEKKM